MRLRRRCEDKVITKKARPEFTVTRRLRRQCKECRLQVLSRRFDLRGKIRAH